MAEEALRQWLGKIAEVVPRPGRLPRGGAGNPTPIVFDKRLNDSLALQKAQKIIQVRHLAAPLLIEIRDLAHALALGQMLQQLDGFGGNGQKDPCLSASNNDL